MPQHVRNFFLNLLVGGKQEEIATGPRDKDGGFTLRLSIRDGGNVKDAGTIQGYRWPDGRLTIDYTPSRNAEPVTLAQGAR